MGIRFAPLFLTLFLLCALAPRSSSQSFKCNSTTNCFSLIDYVSPNATTLSNIKTLFSIRSFRSFLGANNLPLSTPPNQTVAAKQRLKVPFPCICSNGTGISNRKPIYTIQKDDTLYHIAAEVFARLVLFPDIAKVNNISNPDKILQGDSLWIPLPCSCDDVDGDKVVHYGHVVAAGSTLEGIALTYGTTPQTLSLLNNVTDATLLAEQVLDVPLRACNSSVQEDSEDYPFHLANNTYVVTANGCVKCTCDVSTINQRVQCEPSGIRPSNWKTCPAMQCESSSLLLGNSTSSGCSTTTCAYAGYSKNQTQIFTTLATESTCPAGTPSPSPAGTPSNSPPGSTPPGSDASRIVWSCSFLFIAISLLLL